MAKMPKKVMGFDVSYLKKELKERPRSKMSKSELAHEKKETKAHETREHAAVQAMLKKARKK